MYYYTNNGGGYYAQCAPGLKGRPVASIEEAKVANVDFDGSLFLFPDLAHDRIYTKQIYTDGKPVFNVYELNNNFVEQSTPNNYITREEFEQALETLKKEKTNSPAINF